MSIEAIEFIPPNAEQKEVKLKTTKLDEVYLTQNKVKVTTEKLSDGEVAYYFDDGHKIEDNPREEVEEVVVLKEGRSVQKAIAEGVKLLKERRVEGRPRWQQ